MGYRPKMPPTDSAALRHQRAEAQVRAMKSPAPAAQTPEEIQQMLHELRVNKAELEMQNEELLRAQLAIEAERARYSDFYDLAPLGYLTLSEQGLILEANLTAAAMLGMDRSMLLKQPLTRLILKEDQDSYYRLNKHLPAAGEAQECELRLVKPDGTFFWAHLAATAAQAEDGAQVCRIVFSDISERKRVEAKLLELNMAVEQSADGIALADMDEHIVFVNRAWAEMHGYAAEELIGQHLSVFHTPEQLENEVIPFSGCVIATGSKTGEIGHCRKDGTTFIAQMAVTVVKDTSDTPSRLLATARDITERKQAEQEIAELNRDFVAFLENTTDFIFFKDKASRFRFCSQTVADITGHAHWRDMVGKHDREVFPAEAAQSYYEEDLPIYSEGVPLLDKITPYFDASGNKGWISTSKWPLQDEKGAVAGLFGISHDVTERYLEEMAFKEHQAQLEYIAYYDVLTSLPSRLLLVDRLRQAMTQATRRGQRLAVAFLDLDGFKAVNDNHGHAVGDQLLVTLAKRMTQVLRDGDTLGRLGGDEFVAVLVDLSDVEASVPILARLLEVVAQPFPVGDTVVTVSASLGVTFYPQSEVIDADQLLRQADQAMYQAKQAGKNRYHAFDAEHDCNVRGHHENLEHIRQALADRQFVLFYQPKVNMHTGVVIGAEALIRWQHPQRGLLLPAAFLSIIEDQPLAIELGEWVIDSALTQIEAWRAIGLSIPVSVNVGALQLQHPDFVACLRTLLARHPGVNPRELELEILETSALENFAGVTLMMASCQALGVGFALDDFGTGYSSLPYLKRLPAGLLKIGQSFVRDMLDDPDDLAILESVLGLATAFQRQVIAEGVETLAHGEMLLRLGCEWAQGYAIARPMPAQDFQGWLSAWDAPPTWKAIKPISKDRLQVLFAAVEHRAWIADMADYLSGKRDTPPELDAHQCRFGHWLDQGGRALLLGEDADHLVDALHREIHRLATELMALKRDGRFDEVQSRISELHRLRDQLLEQLSELY